MYRMYIRRGDDQQQPAANNQQAQPVVHDLYQINDEQLNYVGAYTNQLYSVQQQQAPHPGFSQSRSTRELLELEHYLHPALIQKSQLESMIAGADFAADLIDRMEALEPILEYKALIAFDLLKLSTVVKHRLQRLNLAEVDSGLLRQQLITSLDLAWTTNNSLIQGLVAAARSIPQSTLAERIEAALWESGMHQAMGFSVADEDGVMVEGVEDSSMNYSTV